jgi:hypothetical protein
MHIALAALRAAETQAADFLAADAVVEHLEHPTAIPVFRFTYAGGHFAHGPLPNCCVSQESPAHPSGAVKRQRPKSQTHRGHSRPAPARAWINLDTAIVYVKDIQAKTKDPVIRRNADKTLQRLTHPQ